MTQATKNGQSPIVTGILGRCPRCGEGSLFHGFLKPVSGCDSCGLDLEFADSGDGPAIFIIFIVGFIVMALAVTVEMLFKPSMAIHLLLWIPTTIVLSIALLRPFKGIMIALQFRHDAHEGIHE